MTPLLRIEGLRIAFKHRTGATDVVRGVDLEVGSGETVGLVGESGSGKSLTCRSIIRLMPSHAQMTAARVEFEGRDVMGLTRRELRAHRAHNVGMIFQDPFSCFDPTKRVGEQVAETLRVNAGMDRAAARDRALELLVNVDIDRPEQRYRAYPHELSGGMRQRVMIAIAISAAPKLLIADEPTTALDVTTQAQILALIDQLRRESEMAVLLVSHDFGVIAQACDRVAVMYGGHVVEAGPVNEVCARPQHPYTRALLESIPSLESAGQRVRRAGIPGQPPNPAELGPGCPFVERCAFARDECREVDMVLTRVAEGHVTACPFVDQSMHAATSPGTAP
ncbi:MAG: ABC transporter ATP-binding protein [Acidimicrobiales bacterium]